MYAFCIPTVTVVFQFMESEVPFTEIIDCDDAGDETICDIDYSISDVKVSDC